MSIIQVKNISKKSNQSHFFPSLTHSRRVIHTDYFLAYRKHWICGSITFRTTEIVPCKGSCRCVYLQYMWHGLQLMDFKQKIGGALLSAKQHRWKKDRRMIATCSFLSVWGRDVSSLILPYHQESLSLLCYPFSFIPVLPPERGKEKEREILFSD